MVRYRSHLFSVSVTIGEIRINIRTIIIMKMIQASKICGSHVDPLTGAVKERIDSGRLGSVANHLKAAFVLKTDGLEKYREEERERDGQILVCLV